MAEDSLLDTRGGYTKAVYINPTIIATAYTANDVVGGRMDITNALRIKSNNSGILNSVAVIEVGTSQKIQFDITLYHTIPGASTLTDASALVNNAADANKVIPEVISLTDYKETGGLWIAQSSPLLGFDAPKLISTDVPQRDLHAVAVTRGTPTYGLLGLWFVFTFLQD